MIYPNKPLYLLSLLGYIYCLTYYTLTTKDNIIMASPFIVPQLLKMQVGANWYPLIALSPSILSVGAILIGVFVLAVSAGISVKVYCKADLS